MEEQKNGELMSKAENLIDEAVRKGYLQGFQEGRKDAKRREEDAYREGHNAGMREMQEDDAYQRGLDDAWEAARKIALSVEDGGLPNETAYVIFGMRFYQVFRDMSVTEVIAILEDYEKKETKSKAQAEPEQNPERYRVQRTIWFDSNPTIKTWKEETEQDNALDEAIAHAEEIAKANEAMCESYSTDEAKAHIRKCAEDHRQLAEWLRDYKRLK